MLNMLLVGNQKDYILLNLFYNILFSCITWNGYKIEIKFNKSVLIVEQNNYTTKIINASIVYDLDNWPRNL